MALCDFVALRFAGAEMRGSDAGSGSLFSYVDLEKRVRLDHPLRVIRGIVNIALAAMSTEFEALYASGGRESIPPERLLRRGPRGEEAFSHGLPTD